VRRVRDLAFLTDDDIDDLVPETGEDPQRLKTHLHVRVVGPWF